jgi:serpin B
MMTQTASFKYWENDICQVLELPYFGGDQSLVIFLPIRLSGLRNLEESFTIQKLAKWLSNLHEQMVTVFLPRFNITSEFSLAKVFQSMGMSDAFSELADFSGINGRKDLFISEILHKAFWEVIEEGSEATAGTGVVMKGRSASISKMFRADHPFFFLIRDNQTGSIFFVGRVINPSE